MFETPALKGSLNNLHSVILLHHICLLMKYLYSDIVEWLLVELQHLYWWKGFERSDLVHRCNNKADNCTQHSEKNQREIQSLFVAQENTVEGDIAGIPCSQVLQLCACLMQHALDRRVHRRTNALVQHFDLPNLFFKSTLNRGWKIPVVDFSKAFFFNTYKVIKKQPKHYPLSCLHI